MQIFFIFPDFTYNLSHEINKKNEASLNDTKNYLPPCSGSIRVQAESASEKENEKEKSSVSHTRMVVSCSRNEGLNHEKQQSKLLFENLWKRRVYIIVLSGTK